MARFKKDAAAQEALANTVKLADVKAEDFDTVFYPGGHGPMWDLAESRTSIALLEAFYNSGKPIALVCHAPGVLRHVTYQGAPLVKGKHVTGFTNGAPGYIQIANTWLLVNVGGGPTPDQPTVTLSVLADPDKISSFMNIRVADIQACYKLWKSRGAEFITEPIPKYGETRCYIRDPDGYIIEVGQSTALKYG
jgi:putative intracellular protease/amidase